VADLDARYVSDGVEGAGRATDLRRKAQLSGAGLGCRRLPRTGCERSGEEDDQQNWRTAHNESPV
jgi:hypothetical protein